MWKHQQFRKTEKVTFHKPINLFKIQRIKVCLTFLSIKKCYVSLKLIIIFSSTSNFLIMCKEETWMPY